MRTTVTVPDDQLAEGLKLTGAKSRSEAIRIGFERFLEQERIERFLDSCGSSGYDYDWQRQRQLDAELDD